MRRGSTRCALVGCLLSSAACSSEPTAVHVSATEQGQQAFETPPSPEALFACASCHARDRASTTDLILPGAPLDGVTRRESFWGGQENDLLRSVNACRTYFQGATSALSADEPDAATLYAYLESLSGSSKAVTFTVVASVADLPEGDAVRGATVYDAACAGCHGRAGTARGSLSDEIPLLPDEVLKEHRAYSADDQRLIFIEKVRHGGFLGYGGRMPPFSLEVLDDAKLADLLAHLGLYQH